MTYVEYNQCGFIWLSFNLIVISTNTPVVQRVKGHIKINILLMKPNKLMNKNFEMTYNSKVDLVVFSSVTLQFIGACFIYFYLINYCLSI